MLEKYIKRNSAIELLRIMCIWMIILYHLSMHSYGEALEHNILWDIVTNVFHIGVVCFILISGWFGIKASISGGVKLIVSCLFYSIIIRCFDVFILGSPLTIKDVFATLTPIMHEEWWFMTSYIIFYILSPFANLLWEGITEKQRKMLIISLGVIMLYFGCLGHISTINGGRDIITFLFIYYLGRVLRNKRMYIEKKSLIMMYFSVVICIFIGACMKETFPFISLIIRLMCFGYNSPGLIIMAVSFFMYFANMRPFYNKWINYSASSVFSVYLLHENYVTYPFMRNMLHFGLNDYSMLIAFCILSTILVATLIIFDKISLMVYMPIVNHTEAFIQNFIKKYDFFTKSGT